MSVANRDSPVIKESSFRKRTSIMLRKDVVDAEGRFHVHALRDADEAVALLTRRPAQSVHGMVDARLRSSSEDARRFLIAGPTHEQRHRHAV